MVHGDSITVGATSRSVELQVPVLNALLGVIRPVADELGYPATVRAVFPNGSDYALNATERTVAISTVPAWHLWHKSNIGVYGAGRNGNAVLDLLGTLVAQQTFKSWTLDIGEVEGLSASKSPLERYPALDAFARDRCASFTHPLTHEQLLANLTHHEVRIARDSGDDYFVQHGWDGRIFIANDGGSHHFAAAQYIATRLGEKVPLKARLHRYRIKPTSVDRLRVAYEVFAVPSDIAMSRELRDGLRRVGAEYYFTHLPSQHPGHHALFLPRSNGRSVRVASVLRERNLTDLGRHLARLAQGQG